VYLAKIFGLFALSVFPLVSSSAGIIKCEDSGGNVVFTENKSDCYSNVEHKAVEFAKRVTALDKTKISYRVPRRDYIREKGKWDIHVESVLFEGDPELYRTSLLKLNEVLDDIFSVLPTRASQELSNLSIYLMWGENSPSGGRKSGMSYIRKGEPNNYLYLDPAWEHSLVIYSAKNLMYLNDMWSRKAIVHELSHTWHTTNWPEKHPPIYNSWVNAKKSNLYTNVQDTKGTTIRSAYARKNQLEYFAELSAIYFFGGNYYPYNRQGLEKYDPKGYRMVRTLWQ